MGFIVNTTCPKPFVDGGEYPLRGGALKDRFCGQVADHPNCCLPCPITQWTFSDGFESSKLTANYISILSLICNTFLLLTFSILPVEKSHRHFLSIGLSCSLIMIALAFVIPLGSHPAFCYDFITPSDIYSDLSCAWTGALLEFGAMGAVVWIFLRSLWTLLRVAFDFQHARVFKWVAITLGVGLPLVFTSISLPISGASYRLGNVCVPSSKSAFATWFAWLLAFCALSVLLTVWTVGYCLWVFARKLFTAGKRDTEGPSEVKDIRSPLTPTTPATPANTRFLIDEKNRPIRTIVSRTSTFRDGMPKLVAWKRVKRILSLQWRSILLAFIVVNVGIFFGSVFVEQTYAASKMENPQQWQAQKTWTTCLIQHQDNTHSCLELSKALGLSEERVLGSLLLASLIGMVVFAFMVRWSMFIGWYELFRDPSLLWRRQQQVRPDDQENFMLL